MQFLFFYYIVQSTLALYLKYTSSFLVFYVSLPVKIMQLPISYFRIISTLEALSYLLLLGIAMPLKYVWHKPEMVEYVGMAHGVLFVAYVLAALVLYKQLSWSLKSLAIVLVCSLLPFGPFYAERKYLPAK